MIVAYTLPSLSCNLSDTGPSPYRSPDQFFAVLSLEHHAINLSMVAPYDTVTLHTTRLMGDGSEVPGEVTYSVNSPSLSITDGVLKAESPVSQAVLRVTLTHGTITRTDSAVVSVMAAAPDHLRDFGLRLPAGDSAKIATGMVKTIPLLRTSASGANLSTLLVSMVSSDTMVAAMTLTGDTVNISATHPGRIVLSTSTYAYGTVWRDSLAFTVGWPLEFLLGMQERFVAGSATPILDFANGDFTVGVGGCVTWQNERSDTDIDIQFDDSVHVAAPGGSVCNEFYQLLAPDIGGNIAPFRAIPWDGNFENFYTSLLSTYRSRAFSMSGVFTYRSVLHGTIGRVHVCDEQNDTTCAPRRLGRWY